MLAMDCPTRMVLNLQGYRDADTSAGNYRSMDAGTAGHNALAAWLRGENWIEALEYYREYSAENGMVDDRRGYSNMRNVLSAVVNRHPIDSLPFTFDDPRYVEVPFSVPLGTVSVSDEQIDVALIGVMDGCPVDRRTSQRWVLEHKFTGKLDDQFIRRFTYSDPQTTAYCYAVREITGEDHAGCWVNAVQMAMVPSSDRKCKEHGVNYAECGPLHVKQTFVPVERDSTDLDEFRRVSLRVAKRAIQAQMYADKHGECAATTTPRLGPFTNACDWCDYFKWCRVSKRNPALMQTMLTLREPNDRLKSGWSK